jgi:alkane 1-monooxygenase
MHTLTATVNGTTRTWRDDKRLRWALGLIVPALPLGAAMAVSQTGWSIFWWMGPIWILALIPLLDAIVGTDTSNPPDWAVDELADDHYYRWLTYLYLPLQYLSFFAGAAWIASGNLSVLSMLGLSLTVGAVGGIGIANAHELGHKKPRVERRLAKVVLAQTGYGHFYVEHNKGHHNRVATPEDPASSRLGESFWAFLPRCVIGSAQSAWRIEKARLAGQGHGPWTMRNNVLNAWAMTVALFAGTIAVFGPVVIAFIIIQAVFGFSLLEVVNYLEHYGLARQKNENGRYERCNPQHSWNSNHTASNVVLYHLERHSDHHAHPTRRYQALRHFDNSPQLPNGYGGMIGLAYIPPLWRRVMDHRVIEHYDGDLSLANIEPRKEKRYQRACGSGRPATGVPNPPPGSVTP